MLHEQRSRDNPPGYSNSAEYLLGTVPTQAASRLRFWVEPMQGDAVRVTFSPFVKGRRYQLQARSDLEAGDWVSLVHAPPTVDARGYGTIIDPDAPAAQRFYRLHIVFTP